MVRKVNARIFKLSLNLIIFKKCKIYIYIYVCVCVCVNGRKQHLNALDYITLEWIQFG